MTIPHYLSPYTTILLFILSGFGWTLSFYFYGVYKKFIPDMVWWMPTKLQMAKCRCKDIVDTPFGKILGQSNSFWGNVVLYGNHCFHIIHLLYRKSNILVHFRFFPYWSSLQYLSWVWSFSIKCSL